MSKIIVTFQFDWDESGTEEDEQNFGHIVHMMLKDKNDEMSPLSFTGLDLADVRSVRGDYKLALQLQRERTDGT